jgi:hypothetical protein
LNRYQASFFIGKTDGEGDFEMSDPTYFVLENWKTKARARLLFQGLEISSGTIEEVFAFNDDDNTHLLYLDCEFEITEEQKTLLQSVYEFGAPSSDLFSLDCGQYTFTCGSVEELDD